MKKKPKLDVNRDVLSIAEAAEVLGLAVTTVRQHAQRNHLPGKLLGRDWAFLRVDVEAFTPRPRGRPAAEE